MSTDDRQVHVCINCKRRKKKCDKGLPSCGYCIKKKLICSYQCSPCSRGRIDSAQSSSSTGITETRSLLGQCSVLHRRIEVPAAETIPAGPTAMGIDLYLQVNRIIRSTGQFMDDLGARYFSGIHHFIPMVSRTRFHRNLITLGAAPSADFSMLLLSICLITHSPGAHSTNVQPSVQHSIHMSAKSIYAQLQVSLRPSVYLIQAGLLIALYEYSHGQPDVAFASLASCARMANTARVHVSDSTDLDKVPRINTELDVEEEAHNTWWGLVICERTIVWEATVSNQPLVTTVPGKEAHLPTEPEVLDQSDVLDIRSIPKVLVSSHISTEVGGFGRAAQAAMLSDQVISGFKVLNLGCRLVHLDDLDCSLQAFLGVVIQQREVKLGEYCGPVAIAIRTLFALHWHIISLPAVELAGAGQKSPEEWYKSSRAALLTITKMTLDIASSHKTKPPHILDTLPPSCAYIIRAALKNIHDSALFDDILWPQDAEERLWNSLKIFNDRWDVHEL